MELADAAIPNSGFADSGFLASYLPYLLRHADQVLSAPFYAVLTDEGVARSEWRVLAVLHEVGELSVAALATVALSPQPTVTHAVSRLESRGLIQRKLGTDDKRQRFVSVTPVGAKLTKELIIEAKRLEGEALSRATDLSDLLDGLKQLTAAIESAREHAERTSS